MNAILLCFCLATWVPLAAWAQALNPQPIVQFDRDGLPMARYVPEYVRAAPTILSADNVTMLLQVGSNNVATASQNGDANLARLSVMGSANATTTTQQGNGNTLDATLRGNNNALDAHQTGNGNEYDLDLTGSNNPIRLVQTGTGNRVDSNLTGNNRQYTINQLGNDNQLSQREGTDTLLPTGYKVEMVGTGIRMVIEQGKLP